MELEHGELAEIHLQHNRDVMGFSRKKTLGSKGLMPYPPLAVPAAEDGGLCIGRGHGSRFSGLKTAGGQQLSQVSIHPFQPVYWSIYAIPSDNTSQSHPPHLPAHLSLIHLSVHPSTHPSLSLSLLSVMENLLFTKPLMRCRQCKINEDTCSTI